LRVDEVPGIATLALATRGTDVADIVGFAFDNMLLFVTGTFGAVGLTILGLVWLRILPGRDLLPMPKVRGTLETEPESLVPPKA
jgi:hypothetical protein